MRSQNRAGLQNLYLLAYLDDDTYTGRILVQVNKGERRHGLARVLFHGQPWAQVSAMKASANVADSRSMTIQPTT